MRIAFSGSHRVGKTSLIEQLAERLPRYETLDEPYALLEEDGHEAADPPSIEDFELQLTRSLDELADAGANVLFDRCPADILAYLTEHEDADAFDAEDWLDRIREAVETLDLIVFVPIESRDRIAVPPHEDRAYRRAVHERLHALLVDDELGADVEVLVVSGDLRARVEQVLARIAT